MKNNKPEKKLDLRSLEKPYANNIHRSGWNFAMETLKPLHTTHGIILDPYIEKTFNKIDKCNLPYTKEWIGFSHLPHNIPSWHFDYKRNNNRINDPVFIESMKYCKGIFTLSKYHQKHLQKILDIPVCSIYHPTETPDLKWSYEKFGRNKTKKVIQLGYYLRKMYSIYRLPNTGFKKVLLRPNSPNIEALMELEKRNDPELQDIKIDYNSVEIVNFIPNDEYDKLLSENIAFVHLYDASANNSIIECIVRNTPILVNPLEPVIEYLGHEYPFYFNTLEEAAEKLEDHELIYNTHLYLRNLHIKKDLNPESFLNNFTNSKIYTDISAISEKKTYINHEIESFISFEKFHNKTSKGNNTAIIHWQQEQKKLLQLNNLKTIEKNIMIERQNISIICKNKLIQEMQSLLNEKNLIIKEKNSIIKKKEQAIKEKNSVIEKKENALQKQKREIKVLKDSLDKLKKKTYNDANFSFKAKQLYLRLKTILSKLGKV